MLDEPLKGGASSEEAHFLNFRALPGAAERDLPWDDGASCEASQADYFMNYNDGGYLIALNSAPDDRWQSVAM